MRQGMDRPFVYHVFYKSGLYEKSTELICVSILSVTVYGHVPDQDFEIPVPKNVMAPYGAGPLMTTQLDIFHW